MASRTVKKFAAAIKKAFSTVIDAPFDDQLDFDHKHQRRFKAEYDKAIELIAATTTAEALHELMAEYLGLFFKYEQNRNNVRYYRSDQTFFELFDRSSRITPGKRDPFAEWTGLLRAGDSPAVFNPILLRYAVLSPTYQSQVAEVVKQGAQRRRDTKSILDLLKDAYRREHGDEPSARGLHDFDPYESSTLDELVENKLAAMKSAWAECRKALTEDRQEALRASVEAVMTFVDSTAQLGELPLFHLVKNLGDRIRVRVHREGRMKVREAGDTHVVTVEFYVLACLALLRLGMVKKLLKKNRHGFTDDELRFFLEPLESSFFPYVSNVRSRLQNAGDGISDAVKFTHQFLFLVLMGHSVSSDGVSALVELEQTMAVQKKWSDIRALTTSLETLDEEGQARVLGEARSLRVLSSLLEIVQTRVSVGGNGPVLQQGTIRAGVEVGTHRSLGSMTVVYIDPDNTDAIYVEYAQVRPWLFRLRQAQIADALYGERIMSIYRSTVGMVYVSQAMFLMMGFFPVLIEEGFAALVYEVLVFYASTRVEELASKYDSRFGKVLGLILQVLAPRPRFGPRLKAADEGRAPLLIEDLPRREFSECLASIRDDVKLISDLNRGVKGVVTRARDKIRDKAMSLELGNVAEVLETNPAALTPEGALLRVQEGSRGTTGRGSSSARGGGMSAAEKNLRASAPARLLEEYLPVLESDAALLARKEINDVCAKLRSGTRGYSEAQQELTNILNAAKESTGEYVADGVIFGNFDVINVVSIPRRANGVPMLDRVYKVRNPTTRKLEYLFVEVKGGPRTRLGWVTEYEYAMVRGKLVAKAVGEVRQASPTWYFQKMIEIYQSGHETLARRLFDAAREGHVQSAIIKSGRSMDPTIIFQSEEFVAWFAGKKLPFD